LILHLTLSHYASGKISLLVALVISSAQIIMLSSVMAAPLQPTTVQDSKSADDQAASRAGFPDTASSIFQSAAAQGSAPTEINAGYPTTREKWRYCPRDGSHQCVDLDIPGVTIPEGRTSQLR
jgi:hypothetical protein